MNAPEVGIAAVAVAAITAGCTAGLAAIGAARWQRLTVALQARLEATRRSVEPARYDAREIAGLPAPVQRYFRAVLSDGMPMIGALQIEQAGAFNVGESRDRWCRFDSTQRVVTQRPGFVWSSRVHVLPLIPVHVHDAYVAGEGLLQPALLGLVGLGAMRGGGELARGELMRFLAEAAWYPTALLPSQGVRWQAIDDRRASATLIDAGNVVTLEFGFGDDGLMQSCTAAARGRSVGGRVVPTPWQGRWFDYRQRAGLLVPTRGEVAWLLPEGEKAYWRGTVKAMRFEFAA